VKLAHTHDSKPKRLAASQCLSLRPIMTCIDGKPVGTKRGAENNLPSSYCEMTICEVLVIVKEELETNGKMKLKT
jgi:hypothetical protein